MIFRILKVSTGDGPSTGFFFSRGLFTVLIVMVGAFGFMLAALVQHLWPAPETPTPVTRFPDTYTARFPATTAVPPPPAREVPASISASLSSLLHENAFESVLTEVGSLSASYPGSRIPLLYRIQALVQLGRHSEAEQNIREALRAYPSDPETLIIGASYYHAIRNPLAAEKMLLRALKADPNRVGAMRGLVTTYLQAGLWRLAKEIGINSLHKFPADPVLTLGTADAARLLGEHAEAANRYQEYLRLQPHSRPDVHFSLATSLRESGAESNTVCEQYQKALSLQASHVPTLNDYALFLATKGRTQEAISLVPALLKHSATATIALDTAGLVHLKARQVAQAEMFFRQALAGEPHNPIIAAHLAALCHQQADQSKADEWLSRAKAECKGDQVEWKRALGEYESHKP
ncbi:MAG TPA: hypothetical protein PKO06_01650 [Candidatus Ozemobacteraceae bacterium]|nr:hypothetical protein [Candidatus Ozemobacteraceae bacterium]